MLTPSCMPLLSGLLTFVDELVEHQLIKVYVLGLIGPPCNETFDTLPVKNCGTFVEKSDSV